MSHLRKMMLVELQLHSQGWSFRLTFRAPSRPLGPAAHSGVSSSLSQTKVVTRHGDEPSSIRERCTNVRSPGGGVRPEIHGSSFIA